MWSGSFTTPANTIKNENTRINTALCVPSSTPQLTVRTFDWILSKPLRVLILVRGVHPRESAERLPPSLLIVFLVSGAGGELTLELCRVPLAPCVPPLAVCSNDNPSVHQLYYWLYWVYEGLSSAICACLHISLHSRKPSSPCFPRRHCWLYYWFQESCFPSAPYWLCLLFPCQAAT